MVLIHGTNIIVDDFSPRADRSKYIYFLTHFHADFFKGINKNWKNQKIYCSPITKNLLLDRFPYLKNVKGLNPDHGTHIIYLDKKKSIYIEVTMFDANHCIGSVMILFNGFMGKILHTGDFRYSQKMLTDLKELFPPDLKDSKSGSISIHIDEIIIDSTYCDPVFQFPRRNNAFRTMTQIIDENKGKTICVVLDKLGKEELLVNVATHYGIKILVDAKKMEVLDLAEYYVEFFTTNPKEAGPVQIISKSQIAEKMNEGAIVFIPTGLANASCVQVHNNCFAIGYSLHSNFDELQDFIKKIKPSRLTTSSKYTQDKIPFEKLQKTNLNQFLRLRYMKQNGFEKLERHCEPHKLSELYKNLLEINILSDIQKELGLVPSNMISEEINSPKEIERPKKDKESVKKQDEEINATVLIEEEEEGGGGGLKEEEEEERPSEEPWQKIYDEDRDKFGDKEDLELTEAEKQILEALERLPEDYIPFSDTSDHEEDAMDLEEPEEEEDGVESGNEEDVQDGMEEERHIGPHMVYSGVMKLSVTTGEDKKTCDLKEAFTMYTEREQDEEDLRKKKINFNETLPYSDVELLFNEFLEGKESLSSKSFVHGWIKSDIEGQDSLLGKLAEHMKKKNYVRYFQINQNKIIYFFNQSQIGKTICQHENMLFLIVTSEQEK